MPIKAGTVNDFGDSMAEAIELAFQAEWSTHKDIALGDAGETDRQILFAAIAQGVVTYLKENISESLTVDVSVTQESGNDINSSGSNLSVTQNSSNSNRVISSGEATNIDLQTE